MGGTVKEAWVGWFLCRQNESLSKIVTVVRVPRAPRSVPSKNPVRMHWYCYQVTEGKLRHRG